MTAATSQKLADTLRAAGFEGLAARAEADEFHDFLSPHAQPDLMLDEFLVEIIQDEGRKPLERQAATNIRARHHNGDFDASREESDEWAAGPGGQAAFSSLVKGKDRKP